MRRSLLRGLLVGVLAILVGLPLPAATAADTAMVTGLVTLDGSEDPPDGTVDLYRWTGAAFALAETHNLGPEPADTFTFTELPAGNYYLVVRPGDGDLYRDTYSGDGSVHTPPTTANGPGAFAVAEGATATHDIVVQQWGTTPASGTVTSPGGPVPFAAVELYRLQGPVGAFTSAELVDTTTSDGSGNFTFPAISNSGARYTVGAYLTEPETAVYLGGGTNRLTASSWVHDGAETGLQLTLPLRTVAGSVTGGNRTIADTTVIAYLWSQTDGAWSYLTSSGLDAQGHYSLTLPPGTYSLLTTWYDGPNYQENYLDGSDLGPTGPDVLNAVVTVANSNVIRNIVLQSLTDAPANVLEPVLTGTGLAGDALTVTNGTWDPAPAGYRYVWYRWGTVIAGATGSSYTVTNADAGEPISVQVRAVSPGVKTGVATSNEILAMGRFTNTAAPTITGSPLVGSTLTATTGTWSGQPTLTITWLRDGLPIDGATGATYVVVEADAGHQLRVRVTANRSGYQQATADSPNVTAKAVLTPTVAPTLSGTGQVGSTLTLNPGVWPGAEPTQQWLRNGVPIPGATALTHQITVADAGTALSVRVSASTANAEGTATTTAIPVAKLVSTTVGKLAKAKIPRTARVKFTVTVSVAGLTRPTGTIRIYDKAKLLKTVQLTAAKAGKVTVKLPRFKAGRHKIKAVYSGTAQIAGSTSKVARLRVT